MVTTYNLFISHSWTYGDAYEKLVNFLKQRPYFNYNNYSVPKDDPIHNAPNEALLYEAIKRQIAPSSSAPFKTPRVSIFVFPSLCGLPTIARTFISIPQALARRRRSPSTRL